VLKIIEINKKGDNILEKMTPRAAIGVKNCQ